MLKTPTHTLELGQCLDDGSVRYAQLGGNRNRRQCIEHIVAARQIEQDVQRGFTFAMHGELHHAVARHDVGRTHLGIGSGAVGDDGLGYQRHDRAHMRVIGAQHGRAVERQSLGELDEGRLQAREIVPVGFHVVGVDIGDDGDHRLQVEEGGVGFVGLHHDEVARAQFRIGTRAGEAAADHEGGVQTTFCQHTGNQAGGGGLAMRAGNRHALLQAHQFGQHEGARYHRNAGGTRGLHFRIVAGDCRGNDDSVGAQHVASSMPFVDGRAQRLEPTRGRIEGQVGAADAIAQVEQHLGDAGHAGTTDADEMNVFDLVLHGWLIASFAPLPCMPA